MLTRARCKDGILQQLLKQHRFAQGYKFHFRRDNPLARIVHLAEVFTASRAPRNRRRRKAQVERQEISLTSTSIFGTTPRESLSILTLLNPFTPQGRQTPSQANADLRVCVGARGVVNPQGRVSFGVIAMARICESDLSIRYANVRTAALQITLARRRVGGRRPNCRENWRFFQHMILFA